MRIAITVAAFSLAACTQNPTYDYETAVKSELRDPGSAEFSDVTVNGQSACGFVNSKNGFGGYAGAQPFVATASTARVIDGSDKSDTDLVAARCTEPARQKIIEWMAKRAGAALEKLD